MRKYFLIAALFALSSVQVSSASYLYTFSSGDILDPNADATYGFGRIDFDSYGVPYPTVIESGDKRALGAGKFTRSGKEYIYITKTLKHGGSTTHRVTDYSFYDPSVSVSAPLNKEERSLSLPENIVASADILLPPDEANGLIYAIDGNTLRAINPLTWTDQATTSLSTEYNVHNLVSLWPDSHNYLYVWSSKRENITASGDYTPISSDIYVYDRETLAELAVFRHVRTGFDTTMRKSDDEAALEMGRGLVFVKDGLIAYVAYDEPASKDAHASIWCIDETGLVPESTRTVSSKDINGFDVDIESPMPDTIGGFYFVAESGDLNANLSSSDIATYLYHYSAKNELHRMSIPNVTSNAELVITEKGQYQGHIFTYTIVPEVSYDSQVIVEDNSIFTFFWDGVSEDVPMYVGAQVVGVEIEKPFTFGNGFYFSMETKAEATHDEKDAIYFWEVGKLANIVWDSPNELEVEEPPHDGNGGFYFVNVDLTSPDANTLISTMTLFHARPTGSTPVCDLGSFVAPPSTFIKDPKDPQAIPAEKFQNEFALVEISEQNQLFVGAGPVGGKFRLTVFDWTKKAALESGDNVIITYNDEDMGGNANIGGMVKFTEAHGGGSSSGCDTGIGVLCAVCLACFMASRRKI